MNYTKSTGDGKHWVLKPEEEWVFVEAPRLISDELYKRGLKILENMSHGRKPRRPGVYLFTGIIECECGSKMYMRKQSPRYVCHKCKNKIEPDIVEEAFHGQLENFLFSDTEIQSHLDEEYKKVKEKKALLEVTRKEYDALHGEIKDLFRLHHEGQIPTKSFKSFHEPLNIKLEQREQTLLDLQSQIDALETQTLSSDQVLHDARNLHKMWPNFSKEEKRDIIQAIVKRIVVGESDILLELDYLPVVTDKADLIKEQPNKSIACSNQYLTKTAAHPPIRNSISYELVRKSHAGSRLWI